MVISELVRSIASELSDNALFEAEQIVMSAMGMSRTELVFGSKIEINEEAKERAEEMLTRRKSGEPLQYILGECEFMSLDFYVERGVLIPRSDTETLAETVLDMIGKRKSVIDICSGSGCIGISLANYNKDITVTLADISDKALEVSARNIGRHNLTERVKTVKLDILKEYPEGKYDVLISNPPYIESSVIQDLMTEVRDFEPRLALDGGEDGLTFYRRIADIAPKILNKGGIIALEIGYNQGNDVKALLERDFFNVQIIKDLCGNDRVAAGELKGKAGE